MAQLPTKFCKLVSIIFYILALFASASTIPSKILSWKVIKKPLVGGPAWLKLHRTVEILCSDQLYFYADFLPLEPENPGTLIKLCIGLSVQGQIRLRSNNKCMSHDDIKPQLLRSCQNYDKYLNLYTNNCIHFAAHFISRIDQIILSNSSIEDSSIVDMNKLYYLWKAFG